jgi:hypothetical protein
MAQTKTLRKGDYELEAWRFGPLSRNTFEPNPVNEGWTTEEEVRDRIKSLEKHGYHVHVSKLQGFQNLPGLGTATVSDSYYTTKGFYNRKQVGKEYVVKDPKRLTKDSQSSITKSQSGGTRFQSPDTVNGSTVRTTNMTETNTSAASTAVAEPLTIKQKVDSLQVEKGQLTEQLNTVAEDQKASVQDRINVIDRKLRWYAGRSKEGTPARPTQAKTAKAPKAPKAKKTEAAPQAEPAPAPAIES